jgi:hypothetical protein
MLNGHVVAPVVQGDEKGGCCLFVNDKCFHVWGCGGVVVVDDEDENDIMEDEDDEER